MLVNTLAKKLKTASGMYENPIEFPFRKEPVSCIVVTKIWEKVVSLGNFARIGSLCVDFYLSALLGYFSHRDFRPNLNFPFEHQMKLVFKKEKYHFVP